MNTEINNDQNTLISIGSRLRKAREQLGLSRQVVAEHLCLKVSTVQDLEEDKELANLASTFLNGYIRSYAKLVQIPEIELSSMMQITAKMAKVAPIQSFSLTKRYKKRDSWLISFIWLMLFTVTGLTATWCWQKYRTQQQDIVNITNQYPTKPKKLNNEQSISSDSKNTANTRKMQVTTSNIQPNTSLIPIEILQNQQITQKSIKNQDATNISSQYNTKTEDTSISTIMNNNTKLQINQKIVPSLINTSNILEMKFMDDCWLEVSDVTNRKLFSGLQHKGDSLSFNNQLLYKLKIGAPEAVQIQFQGKIIDLSYFIKTNQVAHLTLNPE